MISKQLFFIWFGDNKPSYIDYSMEAFQSINPKFKVDLIYYTKSEIVNSQDFVLNYCKDLIFKTKKGINNKYFKFIKSRLNNNFNFIQILSDFIRFELLYYYGGIYVDCDTFPVKPFDDKILNYDCFGQNVLCLRNKKKQVKAFKDDNINYYDLDFCKNPQKYHCYTYTDIYFIGAKKEYTDKEITFDSGLHCNNVLDVPWIKNLENTDIFIDYKNKFYNQELECYKDNIFYSNYIMHFPNRKWKNNWKHNSMYCEYDDYLYL